MRPFARFRLIAATPRRWLVLLVLVALSTGLDGATRTWDGGGLDDNWSNADNWDNIAPVAGDDLVFTGITRLTPVNDLPAGTSFNSITFSAGGFSLSGNAITLAAGIANDTGANSIGLGVTLSAAQSVSAASGTTLTMSGAIANGGFLLTFTGGGTIDCSGAISGTGGLTGSSELLILSGLSSYSGTTTVAGGTLRLGSDVIASTDGACGNSAAAIVLDGGVIESNTLTVSRAITLGGGGGRLDAYGSARTVASAIDQPSAASGLTGSYVASSLRSVTEDDWRTTQTITGTRLDGPLAFNTNAWGTASERAAFGIGGTDTDWDHYSVQWDGYLVVHTTTDLYTRSDDGSRLWLDLDQDGVIDVGEWGSNNWGGGQGATTRVVHTAVTPGIYQVRIQYEEATGGNRMWLLWDDSSQSAGTADTRHIVPAGSLIPGALTLGGTTVASGTGQDLTLSGVVSGSADLVKTGTSNATLSGANTYTGTTVVSGGTLLLGASGVVPDTALSVQGNGTLDCAGFAETVGSLSGSGSVQLGAGTLTAGGDNSSTTFSGVIAGSGGVTKRGTGTFTLTGTNTFTGTLAVDAGTVVAGGGSAIADSAAVSIADVAGATLDLDASETIGSLAGGGGIGGRVALDSFTLTTGGAGTTTSFSGVIAGSGGVTKAGSGTFTLGGSNTFTGPVDVQGGTLALAGGSALVDSVAVSIANIAGATLDLDANETIGSLAGGGGTGGSVALDSFTLTTGGTGTSTTFSGVISGTGGVTKTGGGTFTLANANTFTGSTSVAAGTLRLTHADALGGAAAGTTVDSGAVLEVDGVAVASEALTLSGDGDGTGALIGTGTASWGGTVALPATAAIGGTGTLTMSGVISGSGGLTKLGAGTCILSAAETYTGATRVEAGTLQLHGDAGTIVASSALHVGLDATFAIDSNGLGNPDRIGDAVTVTCEDGTLSMSTSGADRSETIGTLAVSGSSTVTLSTSGPGNVTLTAAGVSRSTGAVLTFNRTHALVAGIARLFIGGVTDGTVLSWTTVIDQGSSVGRYSTTEGLEKMVVDRVSAQTGNWDDANTWTPTGTPAAGESVEVASTHAVSLNGADRSIAAITFSGSGSITGANTLTVSTGSVLVTGSGTPEIASALAFGGSEGVVQVVGGTLTTSGVIGGTGALTKGGDGTLRLTGGNTYSGATTITGGILQAAHTTALGANTAGTTVVAGGALEIDNLAISGESLGLAGTGPGGGALLGTGTASWSGNVTLDGDAAIGGTGTLTISGAIGGAYTLTKVHAGTVVLGGTNTYSGGSTVSAGTLQGTTTSLQGAIANDATLIFDQATDGAYSGVISGTGALVKNGAGSVALGGASSYSGTTTVNAGTLRADADVVASSDGPFGNAASAIVLAGGVVASNTTTFSRALTVTATGARIDAYGAARTIAGDISATGLFTLQLGGTTASGAEGQDLTLAGVIADGTGTLAIEKAATSSVTLGGANTYTGGTTVSAGELRVSTTSLPGDVVDNATLVFDQDGDGSYAGVISGSGTVRKDGIGTVALSGASTFTGEVSVRAGALRADADVVASTAGPFGNSAAAIVIDGGVVESNTITFSRAISVTTNGGRVDAYGAARTVSSPIDVAATGFGGLTASVVADSLRSVTEDDWRDTQSITGTRVDTVIDEGSDAFGTAAERAAFGISGSDSNWGDFSMQWDGWIQVLSDGTSLSTRSNNGSRMWLDLDGDGVVDAGEWGSNGWGSGQAATTVTVHSNVPAGTYRIRIQYEEEVSANSMHLLWDDAAHSAGTVDSLYVVPNYALNYGAFSVGGLTAASATGQDLTLSGVISGAGNLTKSGDSSVILTAANSYGGSTLIANGTLRVGAAGVVPDAGVEVNDTGIFDVNGFAETIGGLSGAGNVTLGSSALTVGAGDTSATFAGVISGTGTFTKSGSGTQALFGANTYSGTTTVSAGTLRAAHASALGDTAGTTSVSAGATLEIDGVAIGTEAVTLVGSGVGGVGALIGTGTGSLAGGVTLSNDSVIGGSGSLTISGVVSSTGALTKRGTGTLSLTAGNTFTGVTTIESGTLALSGDTGAIASSSGITIAVDGTLAIDSSGSLNPDRIGDAVTVTMRGGTLTLTAPLDVNRTETIGSLALPSADSTIRLTAAGTGNAQLTASGGHARSTGATLIFDRTNATGTANLFFTGETDGTLLNWTGVTQSGTTAVGLYTTASGLIQNTATVHTSIISGNWDAGGTWDTGLVPASGDTVVIASTHAVALNGIDRSIGSVRFTGSGSITGSQTLTVNDGSISVIGSGTPVLAAKLAFGAAEGILRHDSSGTLTISGTISGSGGLTTSGPGTVVLSGANGYGGTTSVGGGVLALADGSALGATTAGTTVATGAALRLDGVAVSGEALTLNGAGSDGSGALRSVGTCSFAGNITLGADSTIGGSGELTLGGVIDGGYDLTKQGSSLLILSGANTYTGTTTISSGNVRAANVVAPSTNGAFGNAASAIVLGTATIEVATGTFSRDITVSGPDGRLVAHGTDRTVAGSIEIQGSDASAFTASFVNDSLRSVTEDDWRITRTITGTRNDSTITFPGNAFGTATERAAYSIGGSDTDWANFSVQWDGLLVVENSRTSLYTRSDDGSRVWIDLDGDGRVDASEWGSNGWGNGQGTTTRTVHSNIPAGTYRVRIQYEEGYGDNVMHLLWNDSVNSAGIVDGLHVVPASHLLPLGSLELRGDGGDLTCSGVISGTGGLTLSSAVSVTLSGANTYGGATRVLSGSLLVTNTSGTGTGSGSVRVHGGATLGGSGSSGGTTLEDEGIIAPGVGGTATLTIDSLTMEPTGTSLWQLQIGTASDLIAITGNLVLDGIVDISDAGGFTTGTYTIATYGGTLTDNGLVLRGMPGGFTGTLDFGTAGQIKLVVTAATSDLYWVGGTGNWNNIANWASTSGGAGGAGVPGSTTTVHIDANSGTGTLTLDIDASVGVFDCTGYGGIFADGGRTLSVAGNATFATGMAVDATGTLTMDSNSTLTSAGKSLHHLTSNAGTLTLGDNLTLSGTLTKSGGSLNRAGQGLTLSGAGLAHSVTTGVTLAVDSIWSVTASDSRLIASGVVDDGASTFGVTKNGSGVLELAAANTYDGPTAVDAGTLVVTNATGSATGTGSVTVGAGGTLAGSGSMAGAVTVADGGTIAPGDGDSGTLTFNGGLTMSATTSKWTMDLGTASDRVAVNGNLTIDGVLDLFGTTGFAAGTYTIATYSGTLNGTGFTIGARPAGHTVTIDTSITGQIDVTLTAPPRRYWVGGTGSWNDTTHWSTSSGGAGGASVPDATMVAVFDANSGAGTSTLDIARSLAGLDCTGYSGTLADGGLTLTVAGDVTFDPGMTLTATGTLVLSGETAPITLTSAGQTLPILRVTANHDLTLADAVSVDRLLVATLAGITIGDGPITLRSGVLTRENVSGIENNLTISSDVALGASNDWTISPTAGRLAVSGVISDGGSNYAYTKRGNGTLEISGANTYGGNTNVFDGTLVISNTSGSATGTGRLAPGWDDTIAGTGTISGELDWSGNSHVRPGEDGIGTLTVGSYDGDRIGNLYLDLGATSNDSLVVNGDVDWEGLLHLTDAGDLVSGTYTIMTYSGTLTNRNVAIETMPSGFTARLDLTTPGLIDLVVAANHDRYWVGGTGSWNDTSHWSTTSGGAGGASAPTVSTIVHFDANSGTGISTLDQDRSCAAIDCTGYGGTLSDGGFTLTTYGAVTLVAGMTLDATGTLAIRGPTTVTSAGNSWNAVDVTGILRLADTLTVADTVNITGVIDYNAQTLHLTGPGLVHDLEGDDARNQSGATLIQSGLGSTLQLDGGTDNPALDLQNDTVLSRSSTWWAEPQSNGTFKLRTAANVTVTLSGSDTRIRSEPPVVFGNGSTFTGSGRYYWASGSVDFPGTGVTWDCDVYLDCNASTSAYGIPADTVFQQDLRFDNGGDALTVTFAGNCTVVDDLGANSNSGTLTVNQGLGVLTVQSDTINLTNVDVWNHDGGTLRLTATDLPAVLTSAGHQLGTLDLAPVNGVSLGDNADVDTLTWTTTSTVALSGNQITLRGGTLNRNDVTGTEGIQTLASNVLLGASGTWTVDSTDGRLLTSSVIDDSTLGYSVSKAGLGTLELSAANTFGGGVSVSAGTLVASNTTGSASGSGAVTVASGATLAGTGSMAGLVTVADGGAIAPGDGGTGTLTFNGGLTMNTTTTSTWRMDVGTTSDLIAINGNLTLDGVVDVTDSGGLVAATYTIATYTGALTNNTLTVGTMPAGLSASISTATAGQIDLVVVNNSAPDQVALDTPVDCPDTGTVGPDGDDIATHGRTLDTTPALIWNVPADADGDALHFQVFLDTTDGTTQVADSGTDATPFEYHDGTAWGAFPAGGATQGSGQVRYTPTTALAANDDHFWTVQAADSDATGTKATVRRFLVASPGWTDGSLTANQIPIRKIHLDELRLEANYARNFRALADVAWTDGTITAGSTPIRKTHIDELRTGLEAVRAISGGGATIGADPLSAWVTFIRATHFQELRDALLDL